MRHFVLTILLGLGIILPCQAGLFGHPCAQCGGCQLKKVCRMVPDVKKVPEIKYTIEEDDFCLFGKSLSEKRMVPDECSPCGQRCEKVQIPRCDRVICSKKVKKTTTMVEKPTVKCIVDTICCQCGALCESKSCAQ